MAFTTRQSSPERRAKRMPDSAWTESVPYVVQEEANQSDVSYAFQKNLYNVLGTPKAHSEDLTTEPDVHHKFLGTESWNTLPGSSLVDDTWQYSAQFCNGFDNLFGDFTTPSITGYTSSLPELYSSAPLLPNTVQIQAHVPHPEPFRPIAPAPTQLQDAGPTSRPGYGATTNQSVSEVRVPCTFAGCDRTFRRAADCRRHMKKHEENPDDELSCPEKGCEKTFYRRDKFRDHLRQGHGWIL